MRILWSLGYVGLVFTDIGLFYDYDGNRPGGIIPYESIVHFHPGELNKQLCTRRLFIDYKTSEGVERTYIDIHVSLFTVVLDRIQVYARRASAGLEV